MNLSRFDLGLPYWLWHRSCWFWAWRTSLAPKSRRCDADNGGPRAAAGFLRHRRGGQAGPVRQLAVAPNGDLYAALSGKPGDAIGGSWLFETAMAMASRTSGPASAPAGANDVEIQNGYLYFALNDRILRYRLSSGQARRPMARRRPCPRPPRRGRPSG